MIDEANVEGLVRPVDNILLDIRKLEKTKSDSIYWEIESELENHPDIIPLDAEFRWTMNDHFPGDVYFEDPVFIFPKQGIVFIPVMDRLSPEMLAEGVKKVIVQENAEGVKDLVELYKLHLEEKLEKVKRLSN